MGGRSMNAAPAADQAGGYMVDGFLPAKEGPIGTPYVVVT
jgi:hypothetical protein